MVGRKEVQGNDFIEKGRTKKIKSIKMNRLGLIGRSNRGFILERERNTFERRDGDSYIERECTVLYICRPRQILSSRL